MNRWEREVLEALVREIRREAQAELLLCLKTARLEIEALRCTDAEPQLEEEELGQLEEVE